MKTYGEIRKEMGEAPAAANDMPCSVCRAPTPHEALCNFGSRCGRCFAAYCRDAFSGPVAPVSREEAARRLAAFTGRPE